MLLVVCGACGSGSPATDATTAKLATVEAAHLCDVQRANAHTEAELTDRLTQRLKAAGLARHQWQAWHDSLLTSSARAAELARYTGRGC